jgi:predicted flap endonuclease-1-like 5' DNA nuclease
MCRKFFPKIKIQYVIIGVLIFLWWWVKYLQNQEEKAMNGRPAAIVLPETATPKAAVPPTMSVKRQPETSALDKDQPTSQKPKSQDDLRRIEGIGPKIASILAEAGIESFENLSKVRSDEIKVILTKANISLAQPDTWPEQARLAAEGNWQALQTFQSQLKGGRRV